MTAESTARREVSDGYVVVVDIETGEMTTREVTPDDVFCPWCGHGLSAAGLAKHDAEVLRAAADDYLTGHYYDHFRKWLRERADHIAGDPS